jgi:phosphate starvation-inducible membrane PsiE
VYTLRKLSPDRTIGLILIPFAALVGAALAGVFFGPPGAYTFLAAVFFLYAAYTFLTFIRTHNTGFIVVALFQVSGGLVSALRLPTTVRSHGFGLPALLVACAILLLAWTVILAVTKRIKWRGREVLELAASTVEQTQNGYTGRPMPVGKTDLTREHILGFAEFVRRHLIAATYVGRDRVAFVPIRQGKEYPFILGLKNDYADETWVCFDFSGNVSANVSQRDYLDYREALSFDKLCQSLGDLFVEFAGMFVRGESVRIIGRLDAAGLSMFE